MKFTHAFRRIKSSKSLIKYAEDKMQKAKRFEIKEAAVNLEYSAERHLAKVQIKVRGPEGEFKAVCVGKDYYVAVDMAVAKIESQMLKAKEKIKFHKRESLSKRGKLIHLHPNMTTSFGTAAHGMSRSRRAG